MPCSYFIDTESEFVEFTSYGKVTKDEIIQRFKRAFNDPDWRPGYKVISDYTGADISDIIPSDLDELLSIAVQMRLKLARSKFAFVVPSDLHFALLRMWCLKGGEHIMNIKSFNSRTKALEWLNQTEMKEAVPANCR